MLKLQQCDQTMLKYIKLAYLLNLHLKFMSSKSQRGLNLSRNTLGLGKCIIISKNISSSDISVSDEEEMVEFEYSDSNIIKCISRRNDTN